MYKVMNWSQSVSLKMECLDNISSSTLFYLSYLALFLVFILSSFISFWAFIDTFRLPYISGFIYGELSFPNLESAKLKLLLLFATFGKIPKVW